MSKVTAGKITGLVVALVMVAIFFSMATDLTYTMSGDVNEFLGHIEGNTTLYGTGPAAIAGTVGDNWGYFLVVGVLTTIIAVIGGVFYLRRR